MITLSNCIGCIHYIKKKKCKAFNEIPDEIIIGSNRHEKPIPGDNGIQFEPIKEKA